MRARQILMVVAVLCVAVCPLYSQTRAGTGEWPQWRGPERTGRSSETGLLKAWPEGGPRKIWSVGGLGEGYSGISVKDGRIYTMGTSGGGEAVFALNFSDGKKLWTQKSSDRVFTEKRGNGPRCTPTTDGKYLYTEDALGNVTCWEAADGKRVWQVSLTQDLGGRVPNWGYSESPLIVGRAVVVTPGGRKGAIAALNKKTGQVIWQSPDAHHQAAYSSPILVTVRGKPQIINMTATGPRVGRSRQGTMIGVDAENGKLLWEFSKGVAPIVCCTPVYHEGLVVATSDYRAGTGAADISGGSAREAWFIERRGSHHGGVIRVGDHLYGFIDRLTCIKFKTGEIAWSDPSVGKGSLTYADGHFYCLGEKQGVALVEATPEGYREKGRFRIPDSGRPSWAHPVVVGARLFIRDQDTLTCWDVKAK